MSPFANTPQPPYYVVAFTTQRKEGDHGYEAMAEKMLELAAQQEGYLGVESVRDTDGFGITNSYWDSLASIAAWRNNIEHTFARNQGREQWYAQYFTRIAKVERDYGFVASETSDAK